MRDELKLAPQPLDFNSKIEVNEVIRLNQDRLKASVKALDLTYLMKDKGQ